MRAQDDKAFCRIIVAYTVPKLTDYSAAALEKAAGECVARARLKPLRFAATRN